MEYSQLKHAHTLFVTLFVLSFLIKTILLLAGNIVRLESYRERTRFVEMIIAMLFLITGIIMVIKEEYYSSFNWFWIKFMLTLLVIPVGLVAFKRKNKIAGVFTLLILLFIITYAFIS